MARLDTFKEALLSPATKLHLREAYFYVYVLAISELSVLSFVCLFVCLFVFSQKEKLLLRLLKFDLDV